MDVARLRLGEAKEDVLERGTARCMGLRLEFGEGPRCEDLPLLDNRYPMAEFLNERERVRADCEGSAGPRRAPESNPLEVVFPLGRCRSVVHLR